MAFRQDPETYERMESLLADSEVRSKSSAFADPNHAVGIGIAEVGEHVAAATGNRLIGLVHRTAGFRQRWNLRLRRPADGALPGCSIRLGQVRSVLRRGTARRSHGRHKTRWSRLPDVLLLAKDDLKTTHPRALSPCRHEVSRYGRRLHRVERSVAGPRPSVAHAS